MTIIIMIILLQFIVVEALIIYNANIKDETMRDYLIILGAGVYGTRPSRSLYNRLEKGLEYLIKNPGSKAILTGGMGRGEEITEAEAMRRYLSEYGIAEDRFVIEDKSTDTHENIKFSRDILRKIDGRKKISLVIVTSGFHLFRAKLLARRQGFIPYGIPAVTPKGVLVKYYIREYFGVLKSLIFDW
jgi:uncharacterized SAM-binding protein YcdF (DUF218 family)